MAMKTREWTRDGFLISTDPSLIPIPALTAAFASEDLYWAKGLEEGQMRRMVQGSLCFGLYTPTPVPQTDGDDASTPSTNQQPSSRPPASRLNTNTAPNLIGFARCITDSVTFLYLTDVYILKDWRGQGLGSWLIDCVQEVIEGMGDLRRSMLITSRSGEGVEWYRRKMGMEILGEAGSGAGRGRAGSSVLERVVGAVTGGGAGGNEAVEEQQEVSGGGGHSTSHELVAMSWRGPGGMV